MLYSEIILTIQNLIDEVDEDTQVEQMIKMAIDKAYMELSKIDKRIQIAYVPVINGYATLPSDLLTIENVTPSLEASEKRIGNTLKSDREITFTVAYNYKRERLEFPDDEPDLHESLHYALCLYACAMYFSYRKKIDVSNSFMQSYNMEYGKFEVMMNESIGNQVETIQDVLFGGSYE